MTWKELQEKMEELGAKDDTEINVRTYDGYFDTLYEEDVNWCGCKNIIDLG